MTRVKVTYLAIDDQGAPIASAETQENLKEALDIYYGVEKGAAKCDGWFPFQTEYPDDYEGYYKYSWRMELRDMIDEGTDIVKVYCINFHPHTVYDDKEEQKKLITEIMNEDSKDVIHALAESSWQGCDGCTEADKQMYISGFMAGWLSKAIA